MVLQGHALRLSKKPESFERLTGLPVVKFSQLLKDIEPLWVEAERKRLSRRGRKRAIGAGTPYSLPLCDRLLMLLIYYRTYVTHAFLGFMFHLDDSNVGRCINRLKPCLAAHFRIPERRIVAQEEAYTLFLTARNNASSVRSTANHARPATPARRNATR
jgi:Helix-turn-helix of DDE superfamily endonuclease